MTADEAKKIVEENPVINAEIITFWIWIQGLNKLLKWLAFIGIPVAVGVYALTHRNKQ